MTHTRAARQQDVIGALSGGRTTSTFDLQMLRDQVRRRELAQRMRQLREESPYTQEAIADKIGLKLRSYQKAEQTGGISYEKLQALARVHEVDFDWLLKGSEKGPAPDLMATMEGERSPEDRLAQIEQALAESNRKLDAIVTYLGLEAGITLQDRLDDQIGGVLAQFREAAAARPPVHTTADADQETRHAT